MANRPPDYKARVSGPGALAKRTDLSGEQPIRVASGGAYGQGQELQALQQSVRLPQTNPLAPAGPTAPGVAQGATAPQTGAQTVPLDPKAMLQIVGGHPTANPAAPLDPMPAPPSRSLSFKVDALRYLASLPFSGPEVAGLLKQAQVEYDNAQHAKLMPQTMPSPMPNG